MNKSVRNENEILAEQALVNLLGKQIFHLCSSSNLHPEDCVDACLSIAAWICCQGNILPPGDDGLEEFRRKAAAHFNFAKEQAKVKVRAAADQGGAT